MKKINKLWDYYSRAYDSLLLLSSYRKLIDNVVQNADFKEEELVLDLGSGTGNIESFSNRKTVFHCLDNSEEMIKRLSDKKMKNIASIKRVDLNTFPYPVDNITFDKVISSNSLYTIAHLNDCLKEVNRTLKRGGRFILTNSITDGITPLIREEVSSLSLFRLRKILLSLHKILFILAVNVYIDYKFKTTFYSEDTLIKCLKENGFKILKKEYVYANLNILVVAEKVK